MRATIFTLHSPLFSHLPTTILPHFAFTVSAMLIPPITIPPDTKDDKDIESVRFSKNICNFDVRNKYLTENNVN